MRAIVRYASGLLVLAMLGSPAFAQAKKNPPPKDTIRYFQFSGDLLGDLPIDAFMKETRQGTRVTAASSMCAIRSRRPTHARTAS